MMKKIFSLLTAGFLALGLMGCSGLHDAVAGAPVELAGYYLVGSMNGWKPEDAIQFEAGDDDYHNTVIFVADDTTIDFAFLPTNSGSWDGQIYGDAISASLLPTGVEYSDTDNGKGGRNGTIKGLTKGASYKMIIDSSSGIVISLESAEAPAQPVPYYLDGYVLQGGFLDSAWSGNIKYLFHSPEKRSDGTLIYTVKFTASKDDDYFAIVKLSDNSRWYGELTVEGAPVELSETTDPMTSKKSTGIKSGSKYKIIVTTTPDGVVSAQIANDYFVKLAGAVIIGLDPDSYPTDTVMEIGGEFNEWVSKWIGETLVATVKEKSEVSYATWKFESPFEISDYTTGEFLTVVIKKNSEAKSEADWKLRISAAYQADRGNASADIDLETLNGKDVYLFAAVSDLTSGNEVDWEVLASDDTKIKDYLSDD